MYENMNM